MPKLTLDIDFDLDFDFEIIALVTPLSEYRLCYILQQHHQFDFARTQDLEILLPKKKKESFFSVFKYYNDIDKFTCHIVNNKDENDNRLLPELKNVDYIIKVEGFLMNDTKEAMLNTFKKTPQIQAVFEPTIHELKNKTHLLF